MTDQTRTAPSANSGSSNRRNFLGGLILGGACGSLATFGAIRWPQKNVVQDGESSLIAPSPAMNKLDHEHYMREAIKQARNVPKLPFGAVIVDADKAEIVAEGHNRSDLSPTYHGEVDVINRCAQDHTDITWSKLVLYTTAEPCPMCESAIAWAGIGMVVFGSSIPFLQSLGWWQIDIRAEEIIRRTPFRKCALLGGVLEKECNDLFLAIKDDKLMRTEGKT